LFFLRDGTNRPSATTVAGNVQPHACRGRDGVHVREVRYEADGQPLVGTFATLDGAGPHPAVLIAHEGSGMPSDRVDEF
jgi:hypothetical protein